MQDDLWWNNIVAIIMLFYHIFLVRNININISFQKSLVPPLSPELAVSFYLQNGKLMFAVYHVVPETKTGGSKFNRYQVPQISQNLYEQI